MTGRWRGWDWKTGAVRQMYEEHVGMRADHTHRLFAMLSLGVWSRWVKGTR